MTLIRALWIEQNLSVVALSHKTRLNPSQISECERRRRSAPASLRKALARFYRQQESALFDSGGLAFELKEGGAV
jgi:hypothetical protein